MSDHPLTPKSNSKIVPPFIPKPKESLEAENARLKAEVERLRKAVMHSPAAQLKLKELEGKTTYEEINAAKDGKPTA